MMAVKGDRHDRGRGPVSEKTIATMKNGHIVNYITVARKP